ncbi:metallophosphoesterase [Bythopirellula polymerisocia]|uniref:Phosphodiesterase YaeI n=1 Tax=Bythopirellula polymerisocia TaxID=2528003 RepID=A0A5C6CQ62_9BACT|nr:metallophosphoesterase [Bythopirellula polymerisocia]TWU25757.1 phosphodiesterase YaeI [Bythopirellula polymerisocia]
MLPLVLIVLALGSLIGHGYFWVAIVNRLHGWNGPRRLIDFLTLLCCIAFILLPLVVVEEWWTQGASFLSTGSDHPVETAGGVYLLLCFFIGLGNLLALVLGYHPEDDPTILVHKQREFVTPEKPFEHHQFLGIYPRLLGAIPLNESLKLAIDTKRLSIPRLPEKLAGLRIAHISDLHLTGRIGPEWFSFVANEVNGLSADVIAITGDLIENEACRGWLRESMGRLKARYGVYFILGNHDFFIDGKRTVAELRDAGLIYVGCDCLRTQWNDTSVAVSGDEYPWADDHPPASESPSFRLCLMHTPDQFDWAVQTGVDLALAGHTHGGQVCFPLLGAVAAPSLYGTRYACGTFRKGDTVMHVTRGISGETPLRWNCPPEIAVLELVSGGTNLPNC